MRLGVKEALVGGTIVPGDVEIDDGVVARVGLIPAGKTGLAAPGFVDVHVNGFAGIDFAAAEPDDYKVAAMAMLRTGVTAFQPTLISLPPEAYPRALAAAAEAMRSVVAGRIIGVHMEGPFLSPDRCGAHDPAWVLNPDPELVAGFLETGAVSYMTIAPELPGALDVIRLLVVEGVVVSLGHSDATAAEAHAGFEAGATAVTHLFNAQRPWHHREASLAAAALARADVTVTVIVDGVHLAPEVVLACYKAAAGRFALITDAIAAAGRTDGIYPLGDRTVFVADGVARLNDGTLAGSVLTMDQGVRNLIDLGIAPEAAIGAATTVPATLVGRPELGTLAEGTPADIVVLDDRYEVARVLAAGRAVHG